MIFFALLLAAQDPTTPAPPATPPTSAPPSTSTAPATTVTEVPTTPAPTATPPVEEKAGPKIYVVDPALVKLPAALKLTVSQTIASSIESEGFAAITRDDVKSVIEQQADLAMLGGDADGAALAALGQAVGVQHMVAAVVTQIDGDTLVQLRLIDSSKVSVLARRDLKASETGGELVRAVQDAARLVLQPLFAEGRATINLAVSEEGADVLVDGKQIAVSPAPPKATELGMTAGWHLVSVSKKGFVSFQETMRVKNGETLEKPAVLKPSVEFLKEYRGRNGLYRTLAWTTTGITLLSAAALAGSGFMYFNAIEATKDKTAEVQAKITAENIPSGTAEFNELQADVVAVQNQEVPWAVATPTSGVVLGVGVLLTSYFWIFGDDPNRYEQYEAEMGLQ